MKKVSILVTVSLAICIAVTALMSAGNIYRISVSVNDFEFLQTDGYTTIKSAKAFNLDELGAPDLPVMGFKYNVRSDSKVTGIRIIDSKRKKISGSYNIIPTQDRNYLEPMPEFIQPNKEIYFSDKAYPGKIAEIGGIGFYRGHQIIDVIVYPYEYIPSEKTLYFYSEIDFEFIYEGRSEYIPQITRLDKPTIDLLKTMVENDFEVKEPLTVPLKIGSTSQIEIAETTPCIIITDALMYSKFAKYGVWKTRKGLKSEVKYISDIEAQYADSGMGTAGKIRNYIRDCYQNKGTEYVILGGDVDIIPGVHILTCDRNVLTDQYYACLDYNWNENGDTVFADIGWRGDTVDYYPEVYVGRIPCGNQWEAQAWVDKALTYQRDTTVIGYQSKALFTGSEIIFPNDAYNLFLNHVLDTFPSHFTKTTFYNTLFPEVCDAIGTGQGIMVNIGHAQNSGNFLTLYTTVPERSAIEATYFDTVDYAGQYPVFFNFTCKNAMLDAPVGEYAVLAKSFMLNPDGGGVGYVGSTDLDYPLVYDEYLHNIFGQIFNNNEVRLGKTVADAKMVLVPQVGNRESFYRFAAISHMVLGDPQMEIWTDLPTKLRIEFLPGYDTVETPSSVEVRVLEGYNTPVANATVCLSKECPDVYEITTTTSEGFAVFSNISFETVGSATIVASKQNYFPYGDSIWVVDTLSGGGDPGGCPMLYVYDGMTHRLANNVLAKSEDEDIPFIDYDDYLPVYDIPVMDDGIIRLRISEDEKERSQIDGLELSYISYPADKKPVYTSNNEFRYLSSESIKPIKAVDHRGEDILKQIYSFDQRSYVSSEPGYLIITYSGAGGIGKINADEGGGIPQPPGGKNDPPLKMLANGDYIRSKNIISISVMDDIDIWEKVNVIYPRVNKFSHFVDLSNVIGRNEIIVKVEWTGEISIDCLPFYSYDGDPIDQTKLLTTKATHSSNGSILSNMSFTDSHKSELTPGEYIDFEFEAIVPYRYWENIAIAVKMNGKYEKILDKDSATAVDISFEQNYPNPFNPSTTFSFSLPASNHVNLAIYNTLGRKVVVLTNKEYPAGKHQIYWDGNNSDGMATASGIYFAKLKAGDYSNTKKMVIVK